MDATYDFSLRLREVSGAAALGQGNDDAIAGIVSLLAGSYLDAEFSATLGQTIERWGDQLTLPQRLHVPTKAFVLAFAPALMLALVAIDQFIPGR